MAGLLEINHSAIMKHYWLNDFFILIPPPLTRTCSACYRLIPTNFITPPLVNAFYSKSIQKYSTYLMCLTTPFLSGLPQLRALFISNFSCIALQISS